MSTNADTYYVDPWIQDWNDIIRNVIFPDAELKDLMKIPAGTNIITFIDRYFIRTGTTSALLTDESVRIVYGVYNSNDVNSPHVSKNVMSFDIYVKTSDLHNIGTDRLLYRNAMIAFRLRQLLMKDRYIYGYRFWVSSECDLATTMVGYSRYNISFNFMKVS